MPSPVGSFIGLSLLELQALRVIALQRLATGDRTSLSGGGKSSSKNYSMSAGDMLREINFAIARLTGTSPVRRTYWDASGQYGGNLVASGASVATPNTPSGNITVDNPDITVDNPNITVDNP